MAVTVTLALTLKPEAVEGFCGAFPTMLQDTSKFAGFKAIRVLRSASDPTRIVLIEDWESEDAYHAYIAWRTERGDMDSMGDLIAAPPVLDIWSDRVASADAENGVHA